MNPETDHIAVLGAGTWGITLACLLADQGRAVTAWDIAP
ncbi:NAD(P)-binding protein, partial [Candidatus Sumerlaeota bacterium]|nr:NAD(P)-binding protein [Candidatus Sumerlaeota bacterium]